MNDTKEEPVIEDNDEIPEVDDQTNSMFNPIAYLQEYQLQVNKLLIEQMKALRVNNKYMLKKQNKYKDRQKKIRDIFSEIANRPETPEIDKNNNEQPIEETHEEEINEEEPKNTTSYFENNYENTVPVREVEYQTPPPPVETPQYQNDYEEELDNMAGPRYVSSRRNRIKAFI